MSKNGDNSRLKEIFTQWDVGMQCQDKDLRDKYFVAAKAAIIVFVEGGEWSLNRAEDESRWNLL